MAKRSAPSQDEHKAKRVRVEALSALQDPGAWAILERFLTTDLTFGAMEEEFDAYLGDRHRPLEWTAAKLAIFSGDGDDALSLTNLLALKRQYIQEDDDIEEAPPLTPKIDCLEISSEEDDDGQGEDDIEIMDYPIRSRKNPFLDIEADEDDELDDEIEDDVPSRATVTHLPAPKHNLADAIHRIEQSYQSGSSITIRRRSPVHTRKISPLPTRKIPTRMYVFTVNVSAREYLSEHLEKQGISIVISPWIAAHLYATSDSPQTIMSAVPESLKMSMKKWDRISDEEETAVNALRLKFPYPAWLRIKRGKYRDSIAYVFDPEQENLFVTVLVPPKDFPYDMPKDVAALFDRSRLPTPPSDIVRDGEVVGYKFKGEEYYSGLLKKNFHRYCTELVHVPHPDAIRLHVQSGWDIPFCRKTEIAFSKQLLRQGDLVRLTTPDLLGQICTIVNTDHAFGGSAKLEFEFDGRQKAIEAKLDHVERVFNMGDEVTIVAGCYSGVQGHIVERNDDIFTISQSGTLEQIEVSKYYLDRRPIDRTLHGHIPAPSYVDPLAEPNTIEIGDFVRVAVGDMVGKCGLVQWASGGFVCFQDDSELMRASDDSSMAPPFIHVAASSVERIRLPATVTLTKDRGYDLRPGDAVCVARGPEFRTEGVVHAVDFAGARLTLETELLELVTVPIRFVMKTRNAPLDTFNKFINKEVFVIGGVKKGYRATLYDISTDTCIIAVHGQPRMTVRRCDVATTYGCRLNGAMLEWSDFTSFCEMRRKSYVALPPRSITPPPEKTASSSADRGQSFTWASWSQEDLAETSSQTETTEDPWTVNTHDIAESAQPNPRDPICWLKEFSSQFHGYHALFNVSAGFQNAKLLKRLAYSHSPDPFCGPNGLAPPGHVAAWCTAKTAGGAKVDYHIPVEFLTPAQPRKKNQECFVMDGQYRGGIRTVSKCNTKNRTVELQLLPSSQVTVTVGFDDVCLVEPLKHM